MNKKAFTAIAYLAVLILLSSCSPTVQLCQSNWQDKPVVVNGKTTQWSIPLQYFDNDTRLNYVISNDDTNLYYWIRITDDKEQLRVMRAGMQVWIDTTGKSKQQVGIQFPFSPMSMQGEGGGQRNHSSSPDSTLKDMKKWTGKLDQMRVTGFKYPIVTGITPIPNVYGIKVCILRDSTGVTIYQACIPFKTFYKPVLTAADNNKAMGVTLIINPMPTSGHSGGGGHGSDANGGASGFGNGMHMGGGGGMGAGGGGMHGGGGRSRSSEDNEDPNNLQSGTLKMQLKLVAK